MDTNIEALRRRSRGTRSPISLGAGAVKSMMGPLDALGTRLGTDKGSVGQGYLRHYERNVARFKNVEFTLLEIGIAQGASLSMWLEYFPKATIVGVDVNKQCERFARDRVHVRIGSQNDREFLRAVASEYEPSIIIDDGSHLATHNR